MQNSEHGRIPTCIVPAYPYDDAIFALFHNSLVDSSGRITRKGGVQITYNTDLFPPRITQLSSRAAAVACLFESIVLAPRQAELPDIDTYSTADGYDHPDLRIKMPRQAPPQFGKYVDWMDYGNDDGELYSEWDHLQGIAIELRNKRPVAAFFKHHRRLFPGISYSDFTINTIAQVFLARKYDAVLLGNDVFHEFYRLLREVAPADMELFPEVAEKTILEPQLTLSDIEALSLNFAPATIDTFAAVRMDKDIREHADNWRRIIATSPPDRLRESLLTEMARAYDSSSIARRTKGIFSYVGTFLTWLGLIPAAGLVTSYAGVIADIGARMADKAERRLNWVLIGAKMHTIAQEANLKKFLSDYRDVRNK